MHTHTYTSACVHVCIEGERKYYQRYERGAYTNYERLIQMILKKKSKLKYR